MLQGKINRNMYYRQEINGITVYKLLENKYTFYENVFIKEQSELEKLDLKEMKSNQNVELLYPFCVCCLVENKCNLDCIYCFGDDKMYSNHNRKNIEDIYSYMVKMRPLQISLGGGEPTLNPDIGKIIEYISANNIAIIMDTNGTTNTLRNLIPILRDTDTLVRFSVDSLEDDIINQVRPFKIKTMQSASKLIIDNIKLLLQNNIMVSVQTVLTKLNINSIQEIAEFLVENGIKRWHIAGVKLSEKCKYNYEDIKITYTDIMKNMDILRKYDKYINITHSFEEDYGANVRLLFDTNGEFLTDSVSAGLEYLGRSPSIDTLYEHLDKKGHINRYLGDFYLN